MNPIPSRGRIAVGADRKRRDQKPRVLFSCTSCRGKKLKCDRQVPCDNCKRRGLEDSCQYHATRIAPQLEHNGFHTDCKARIQDLENQVIHLQATIRNRQSSHRYPALPASISSEEQIKPHNEIPKKMDAHEPDIMLSESTGCRSFTQSHWRAIMNRAAHEVHRSDVETSQTERNQVLMLLQGTSRDATIEDLLRALPPRGIADALVLRFLDSEEPSTMVIHIPTFKQEYERFWVNPSRVSHAWLALLFGVLSCAVWIDHSMNPETAELEPPQILKYYKEQCCIALTSSNYTTPGHYKVEAATIYLGAEYLSSDGLKTGLSILVGIVSRLAIMMGYHRDPRCYPQLSTFEGEMRRRVWLVLSIIDYFVAWQSGLPTVIDHGISDTASPRVLLDQHFDINTETLPPPLSDADILTTSSNIDYMIAQKRLMSTANAIIGNLEAYPLPERTNQLNHQLEAAWNQVPAHLKQPVLPGTSSDVMIRVLTLEMTYQRARCILHRQYLINRRDEPTHRLFRDECVHAAQSVLHCQIELFQGTLSQPQCRHKIWFGISRAMCDCLTAAMIISLEILSRAKMENSTGHGWPDSEELIQTLKDSMTSWKTCPRPCLETIKAVSILEKMLDLIGTSDRAVDVQVERTNYAQNRNAGQVDYGEVGRGSLPDSPASNFSRLLVSQETFNALSAFDIVDFTLWEQEMQNLNHLFMEPN